MTKRKHPKLPPEQRLNLKAEIVDHYSKRGGCEWCGITDIRVLTIDHINGGGNKHRKRLQKKGLVLHIWLKEKGFPPGYQILCLNCHWIKTKYGEEDENDLH